MTTLVELRKEIKFVPGRPYRKGYGACGASLYYFLHGPKGTVQFGILTGWYDDATLDEWKSQNYHPTAMSSGIDYHAHVAQYGGQTPREGPCDFTGGQCYCDGSSLQGQELFKRMILEGDDIVWEALLERYNHLIGPSEAGSQPRT